VNVYLVYGNGITVIDTGFNGFEKMIYEDIHSTGRDPSDIDLIVLTHSHPDHIGAAKAIRDLTGCAVAAHPLDAPAIENIDPMLLKSPAPGVPPRVSGCSPSGEGTMGLDKGRSHLARPGCQHLDSDSKKDDPKDPDKNFQPLPAKHPHNCIGGEIAGNNEDADDGRDPAVLPMDHARFFL
jgi:hypothetical protein